MNTEYESRLDAAKGIMLGLAIGVGLWAVIAWAWL